MVAALLAAAGPRTVIEAERAFGATAERQGQAVALRRFADPGAILLAPGPVAARDWLRPGPYTRVRRSPITSWIACDGRWAANTGAWRAPDGKAGSFTTIWHRGSGGRWRVVLDRRAASGQLGPVPARVVVRSATCGGAGRALPALGDTPSGIGASDDATLRWRYQARAGGAPMLLVERWDGRRYLAVGDERVGVPPVLRTGRHA